MGGQYERARLFYRQGRYAHAERELREELAQNPHWGQAHAFLGRCLARQNRPAEALEAGEEGVRLAPQLAYAHFMLGLTLLDLNHLEKSEAALREAMRLEPRNPEQLEWLSWVLFQRGDKRGALAAADDGLAIDPEQVGCLNRRGYCLRWLGDWWGSEAALQAALRLDPENAYTHTNLGWTLWSKAHALSANVGQGFQTWVMAWRAELRDSHRCFLEALRLDPTSDWARSGVAETLLMRCRAAVQLIALLVILGTLLLALLVDFSSDHPADPAIFVGMVVVAAGGFTVFSAAGPVYLAAACNRLGAAILSPSRRLAAWLTATCLAVASAAGAAALFTPAPTAFAVLFLALVLIRPLTVACEAAPGAARMAATAYAVLFAAAGLACAFEICIGGEKEQTAALRSLLLAGMVGSFLAARAANIASGLSGRRPV